MKNALIIFGGVSSEHDVSCVSATSVIRNIPKDKYNVIMMGITKQGEMFVYDGDYNNLKKDGWLENKSNLKKAVISTDRADRGIIVFNENGYEKIRIDVCFPVMHGKNGEDGTLQGLLQLAGIPCVGGNTLSMALAMDKKYSKIIFEYFGIPVVPVTYIDKTYDFDKCLYVVAYQQNLHFRGKQSVLFPGTRYQHRRNRKHSRHLCCRKSIVRGSVRTVPTLCVHYGRSLGVGGFQYRNVLRKATYHT